MPAITLTIQEEGAEAVVYTISSDAADALGKIVAAQSVMQPATGTTADGKTFSTMVQVPQYASAADLIVQHLRDVLIQQAVVRFPSEELVAAQKAVDEATAKRDELRKTDMIAPVSALTPALPVALPAPTAQVKT